MSEGQQSPCGEQRSREGFEERTINDDSNEGQPPSEMDEKEFQQLLIAQFYEDAVLRYGPNSLQAQDVSRLLGPAASDDASV